MDGVDEVFEEMKQSDTIKPNWSTFATLATLYIMLGWTRLRTASKALRVTLWVRIDYPIIIL